MEKLSVIAPRNGKAEKIGEVDGEEFVPIGTTIHLGERGSQEIAELLGDGYGAKNFHLIAGDQMFLNCRVLERAHGV